MEEELKLLIERKKADEKEIRSDIKKRSDESRKEALKEIAKKYEIERKEKLNENKLKYEEEEKKIRDKYEKDKKSDKKDKTSNIEEDIIQLAGGICNIDLEDDNSSDPIHQQYRKCLEDDKIKSIVFPESGASQSHGFIYENIIRHCVFNIPIEKNDTNKHDISCDQNRFDSNENISIKTTSQNKIDCGDILNIWNYHKDLEDKKQTFMIIKYEQKGNYKVIKAIYEVNYTMILHDELFGNITYEILKDYVNNVKEINKSLSREEINNSFDYIKEKKNIEKEYNLKINICPKVDTKSQRRVQCSISLDILKPYITYDSTTKENVCLLRGINIIPKIKSSTRIRNSKNK
jgi:hypothetical protein